MTLAKSILGIVLFVLIVLSSAFADVPAELNYQGKLTDDFGVNVVDGDYSITFKIYDVVSGGVELWSETQLVAVSDGLFAVSLGLSIPIDPAMFENPDLWMGITVDANPEFDPRTKFETSPYAFQAQTVAENSIDSSHVADGSLFAGDLGDEVGIAFSINMVSDTLFPGDGIKTLTRDSINCPTDGYVLVLGACLSIIQVGVPANSATQFAFGVGHNDSTSQIWEIQHLDQPAPPSGQYVRDISIMRAVPVSAGLNVFYLSASNGDPGATSGHMLYSQPTLTLLFIPTSYE